MSKPYGLTADFRIIRPTRIEDKVWDAVEEAVNAGWTPRQMMQEVRECWAESLKQKAQDDDKDFREACK